MEQEDIDLLKVWLCGINDKDVIKTLVLCSEYGSGKTHFIEHQLSNKFNIRNITTISSRIFICFYRYPIVPTLCFKAILFNLCKNFPIG